MKLALITGAAQRLGAHVALEMAKQGWDIALHYRSQEQEARALQDMIREQGRKVEVFKADFMKEDQVQALLGQVEEKMHTQVSCLINNASTFENDTFKDATRARWDLHMEVNFRAPYVLSQNFAHRLGPRTQGNIINFIDQRVWNLTPHFSTYTLSKAGLWAMTQTMAMALGPNIRVNAIGPGPTLPSVRQSQEDFEAQYLSVPLKNPTDLMDISNAILYILGAQSMTGQMIALDGGEHLGWAQGDNHTAPKE